MLNNMYTNCCMYFNIIALLTQWRIRRISYKNVHNTGLHTIIRTVDIVYNVKYKGQH